jgi:hypothetical protein
MNYITTIFSFIITCGIAGAIGYVLGHQFGKDLGELQTGEVFKKYMGQIKQDIGENKKQLKTFVEDWDNLEAYAEERVMDKQFDNLGWSHIVKESNEYLKTVVTNYTAKLGQSEEEYLSDTIEAFTRSEIRSKYMMLYALEYFHYSSDDYKPLATISKFTKVRDDKFEIGMLCYIAKHQMASVADKLEKLAS